ncbi:Txe/YoeB family addiction module toxin [Candidatus Marinimicrobia bacterium MT.SAG.2]|nr:Txe/YoeB family addiction module toxin [Candidatus Neomarinimicrobiota bacterium]MCH8306304.1 Txe/YoeB family addiction module toxin [Candidatus Neomarinimicrobiota bacterium]TFB08621.1 Txe/YoeB family addiction module toxin [Candidatus Marinimicrobia bacterium MT.SAG.2]
MKWRIVYTRQAIKDSKKIESANLKPKVVKLLDVLRADPYSSPPHFEKLLGDLSGAYSRRINIHHRLVYQLYDKEKTVKIIRMWTHYE